MLKRLVFIIGIMSLLFIVGCGEQYISPKSETALYRYTVGSFNTYYTDNYSIDGNIVIVTGYWSKSSETDYSENGRVIYPLSKISNIGDNPDRVKK